MTFKMEIIRKLVSGDPPQPSDEDDAPFGNFRSPMNRLADGFKEHPGMFPAGHASGTNIYREFEKKRKSSRTAHFCKTFKVPQYQLNENISFISHFTRS
jgi:hypothetical protein